MNTEIELTEQTVMISTVKLVKAETPLLGAGVEVSSGITAAYLAEQIIGDDASESLLAMYLDIKNRLIAVRRVFTGTVNEAIGSPREILQSALLCNAVKLIIAHNHPSGDCTPSSADREQAKAMNLASGFIGIEMLDSLVVSPEGAYSIKSNHSVA